MFHSLLLQYLIRKTFILYVKQQMTVYYMYIMKQIAAKFNRVPPPAEVTESQSGKMKSLHSIQNQQGQKQVI